MIFITKSSVFLLWWEAFSVKSSISQKKKGKKKAYLFLNVKDNIQTGESSDTFIRFSLKFKFCKIFFFFFLIFSCIYQLISHR